MQSPRQVAATLQRALQKPSFERWNTTSVEHLVVDLSGANGMEASELARKLLESYVEWYKNNREDMYLPTMGLERMYSLDKMVEMLACTIDDNKQSENLTLLMNVLRNPDSTGFLRKPESTGCVLY